MPLLNAGDQTCQRFPRLASLKIILLRIILLRTRPFVRVPIFHVLAAKLRAAFLSRRIRKRSKSWAKLHKLRRGWFAPCSEYPISYSD